MEIDAQSRPRLPRGVKLKRDEVRERWTLLAPAAVIEKDVVAMLADLKAKRVLET